METKKRLVDVDKAYRRFAGLDAVGCEPWFLRDIEIVLYEQPVVDAVEVVHSQWMLAEDDKLICSNCKNVKVAYEQLCYLRSTSCWNYCPNCGAKMDLK